MTLYFTRLSILLFILLTACSDPVKEETFETIPQDENTDTPDNQEEDDIPTEGLTLNGMKYSLSSLLSNNSEAVDFGDMFDIKLMLENGIEPPNNKTYEVRVYLLKSSAESYSVQNFSPSKSTVSQNFSCAVEIIHDETIYYGYEGTITLNNQANDKLDITFDVNTQSLIGDPLTLKGSVNSLKIAAFNSHDCFVDEVISPYSGKTIARYFYTSEGKLKYAQLGPEGLYFSYLKGEIKEFWHSQDSKVVQSGTVYVNTSGKIETIDMTHFDWWSETGEPPVTNFTFSYNNAGQLERVEHATEWGIDIREFAYLNNNVIESKFDPFNIKLEDYDDHKAPGKMVNDRIHENFYNSTFPFPFDGTYLPLSENNPRYSLQTSSSETINEKNHSYSYDEMGNTIQINGFKISYKYCK